MNGPAPAGANIPYRDNAVTFVQWRPDRTVATSNEVSVKRGWLAEDYPLFAAWTGQRRTDVFEVDVKAARLALG